MDDLAKVPVAWKGQPDADLTRLPARSGPRRSGATGERALGKIGGPGWITATFTDGGYVWYAFKNPAVLSSTVIWIENRGRHGHPWNGRNHCLGLEDVTAYFADGLAARSATTFSPRRAWPPRSNSRPIEPTVVNYIQGVVKVPAGFDVVRRVEFSPGQATFVSASGTSWTAPVHHEFLKTGQLP